MQKGLCSSTPRGDGNCQNLTHHLRNTSVYAAQPREGTETPNHNAPKVGSRRARFMQLNPARGRKRATYSSAKDLICLGLCSSTPRGDGNERKSQLDRRTKSQSGLCSSTPRGDGNGLRGPHVRPARGPGLCSSTPRGDGNKHKTQCRRGNCWKVYAAQPREGTETPSSRSLTYSESEKTGLCSSTPRGDGN